MRSNILLWTLAPRLKKFQVTLYQDVNRGDNCLNLELEAKSYSDAIIKAIRKSKKNRIFSAAAEQMSGPLRRP